MLLLSSGTAQQKRSPGARKRVQISKFKHNDSLCGYMSILTPGPRHQTGGGDVGAIYGSSLEAFCGARPPWCHDAVVQRMQPTHFQNRTGLRIGLRVGATGPAKFSRLRNILWPKESEIRLATAFAAFARRFTD